MTTVPGSLIWEIVKRNNAFLVKEFGNGNQMVQFSKALNNLWLANAKTVSVQSGKGSGVVLANKQKNPSALNKRSKEVHKTVMKKEFSRMVKAAGNQVADYFYRRDLKSTALARLSSVHRSLKVALSGVKKMNRQTSKKSNWV
ncbi:60S ribosomal protein L28-2-like [Papaver somniferum]|uniref:60S ribosomal protein L28-2-like n=1 Tax=Papaver somniferum TaxID=3469 RepID=UPI000E6F8D18|nr:60S ribosomal protein L28-2-like [Papaver somniferum]